MLKSNSMCSFLLCIGKKFQQTFLHLVKKKRKKKLYGVLKLSLAMPFPNPIAVSSQLPEAPIELQCLENL